MAGRSVTVGQGATVTHRETACDGWAGRHGNNAIPRRSFSIIAGIDDIVTLADNEPNTPTLGCYTECIDSYPLGVHVWVIFLL